MQAALAAGRAPNGVFGGRLLAGSRPELLADLAPRGISRRRRASWSCWSLSSAASASCICAVDTIEQLEADSNTWFTQQEVTPDELAYEQRAADPLTVAHQVLDFLDLELSAGHELDVRHRRQADHVDAQ